MSKKEQTILEEAAEEWAENEAYGKSDAEFEMAYKGFIAGAEWQASRMPMPEDTVLFQKGVAEGRRLEREDMLKEAMEGQIYGSDGDHWIESEIYENLKGKEGDKVRIIVVKVEEE